MGGTGFIARLKIFTRYGSCSADTNPKLQLLREKLRLGGKWPTIKEIPVSGHVQRQVNGTFSKEVPAREMVLLHLSDSTSVSSLIPEKVLCARWDKVIGA